MNGLDPITLLLASRDRTLQMQGIALLAAAGDESWYRQLLAGWRRLRTGEMAWTGAGDAPFPPTLATSLWLTAPPSVSFPYPLSRRWVGWLRLRWPEHGPLLPELSGLPGLRGLWLEGSRAEDPPVRFWELPPDLYRLRLDRFTGPDALSALSALEGLRSLALKGCVVSPQLDPPASLEKLEVRGGEAVGLARVILRLPALRELRVMGVGLRRPPVEIAALRYLRALELDCLEMAQLPPELCRIPGLRRLRISSNPLERLPPEVAQLRDLEELDLANTDLARLPPELAGLPRLERLNLRDTLLRRLPADLLATLPRLRRLVVSRSLGPAALALADRIERDQGRQLRVQAL